MPKFRYVAIAPGRIAQKKNIGPASYLHDFLVDHQCDSEGNVNYGKPISYAWIRSKWPDAPTIRTLKRYMRRLKANGNVWVQRLPFYQGMLVRVLESAKWPAQPSQLQLFHGPEIVRISSAKPVKKVSKTERSAGTEVSPLWGQKCPRNAVKNLREEKTNSNGARFARSAAVEDAALEARRRLLADQAAMLLAKVKTSC